MKLFYVLLVLAHFGVMASADDVAVADDRKSLFCSHNKTSYIITRTNRAIVSDERAFVARIPYRDDSYNLKVTGKVLGVSAIVKVKGDEMRIHSKPIPSPDDIFWENVPKTEKYKVFNKFEIKLARVKEGDIVYKGTIQSYGVYIDNPLVPGKPPRVRPAKAKEVACTYF